MSSILLVSDVTPVSDVNSVSDVTQVSHVTQVSDVTKVSDVTPVSDVNSVSDVTQVSRVTQVSDVTKVSDVTSVSDVNPVSDVTQVSHVTKVSDVTMVYLTHNYNYWTKYGVCGPKPYPIVGNIYQLLRVPHIIHQQLWHKKYGKIYGIYISNDPILRISDPQLIKTMFVKDFTIFVDRKLYDPSDPIVSKSLAEATGDQWRRIRSIVSPTFSSAKMKLMYPIIGDCCTDFVRHLETVIKGNMNTKPTDIINAKKEFGSLAMDIIARTAFGIKTNPYSTSTTTTTGAAATDSPFVKNARMIFDANLARVLINVFMPGWAYKLFLGSLETRIKNFFFTTIRNVLAERRKSNVRHNDFVQLLMDADSGFGDAMDYMDSSQLQGSEEQEASRRTLNLKVANKKLSEDEIVAQGLVFMVAAYETTSTALTFTVYELALNPRAQQKLFDEITESLNASTSTTHMDDDRERDDNTQQQQQLNYETCLQLPYLDACISESLRLHSPNQVLQRIAATDYTIPGTGIQLAKGQQIEIPVSAIHCNEEYYRHANTYLPERFMPGNRHLIKPYTYMPFGVGPRNCIAMRFALLEVKTCLAQLVTKYKFMPTSQTDIPLKYDKTLTLVSPKRVIIRLERRSAI
ncbi:cytochrome P450 3A9-like [Oppia nitens]|uniref:cytochrome P450 3A9-like n=1 Tax=Oppia nitens TaxID=1686743 RepID=UPI0023DC1CA9|nr:cytochrome P450 3A9-like [Oppia nitens]